MDVDAMKPKCAVIPSAHTLIRLQFLGKISNFSTYWGVRPATHAASVGLGIFDGVCRQVDLERGWVGVGTEAVGAFVGLVFIVLSLMGLWTGETASLLYCLTTPSAAFSTDFIGPEPPPARLIKRSEEFKHTVLTLARRLVHNLDISHCKRKTMTAIVLLRTQHSWR